MSSSIGKISRRSFAWRSFACITSGGIFPLFAARRIPIALQLYSVRRQCDADLPGTLSGIAKIGYKGVEFAGYHGRQAPELRRMLEQSGLKCCGAHVPVGDLLPDKFPATIEFHRALGNRTVIVPGLPAKYHQSHEAWLNTARLFTDLSQKLQPHHMRIGYHNHALEFQPMDGERPWDTFLRHTPRDVIMELDVGNAGYGGADPIAELKRYPGRAKSVHVKDYAPGKPDLLIGDGVVNWPEFVRTCETAAGTEWFIIEHDTHPEKGLAEAADSLERFRRLSQVNPAERQKNHRG